jgi:phosphopantetheinyl transferase
MTPIFMTSRVHVTLLRMTDDSRDGRRRRQKEAGHALAQAMVARLGGRLGFKATGQPICLDGRAHLSIAHSGPWVGCALGLAGPIGLDLEAVGKERDWAAMAAYFTSIERQLVKDWGAEGFLALWTLREAWAKAQGRGLELALGLDGAPLIAAVGGQARLGDWCLLHQRREGLHLALAAQGIDALDETMIEFKG